MTRREVALGRVVVLFFALICRLLAANTTTEMMHDVYRDSNFLNPTNRFILHRYKVDDSECRGIQKRRLDPAWQQWISRDTTDRKETAQIFSETYNQLISISREHILCSDADYVLGNLLSTHGFLDRAALHFAEGVRRSRGLQHSLAPRARYFSNEYNRSFFQGKPLRLASKSKLSHDAEQIRYLVRRGKISDTYAGAADILEEFASVLVPDWIGYISESQYRRVHSFYNRLVHFEAPKRFPDGEPILRRMQLNNARAQYAEHQIAVVDSLLSPKALRAMRTWLLESTFWFDAKPEGYVGAYFEDGFSSPFLNQVVEELKEAFPKILGPHDLNTIWAYKYDSAGEGIKVHADMAAVNLNFWITPDSANLNASSGGLGIYRREAPLDWDFDQFNTMGGLKKMMQFLEGSDIMKVPYRQNRLVIFNSNLFHYSDTYHFKAGYENRRINLTFLFGRRGGGSN